MYTGEVLEMATYKFVQKIPVPAYLLAMAVGELECRSLGPVSCVWAEPSVVERAAWEFAEMASFISAGEQKPLTCMCASESWRLLENHPAGQHRVSETAICARDQMQKRAVLVCLQRRS